MLAWIYGLNWIFADDDRIAEWKIIMQRIKFMTRFMLSACDGVQGEFWVINKSFFIEQQNDEFSASDKIKKSLADVLL